MTVDELDQQLRAVGLTLHELEEAARAIAAEARTQASDLQRIRALALRDLVEKPKT